MRRILIPIIAVLAFIGLIVVGWQILSRGLVRQAKQVTISNIDLSEIKDGIYRGEYALSPVKVIAEVIVQDKKIHKINIVEHENGFGGKAEVITERIIENQSLNVDSVAGATVSSKVIVKAVENALVK